MTKTSDDFHFNINIIISWDYHLNIINNIILILNMFYQTKWIGTDSKGTKNKWKELPRKRMRDTSRVQEFVFERSRD